ncbi:MAG TPA: hypothetical protein VFE78_32760, partial [Gemmataceae bacterium]|nr:hypothetical protein [Gemmataceae bacterium]
TSGWYPLRLATLRRSVAACRFCEASLNQSFHCPWQSRQAPEKRPRQIEVVSELPKNFLGKVLRRKLREAPAVNGDGHTI